MHLAQLSRDGWAQTEHRFVAFETSPIAQIAVAKKESPRTPPRGSSRRHHRGTQARLRARELAPRLPTVCAVPIMLTPGHVSACAAFLLTCLVTVRRRRPVNASPLPESGGPAGDDRPPKTRKPNKATRALFFPPPPQKNKAPRALCFKRFLEF